VTPPKWTAAAFFAIALASALWRAPTPESAAFVRPSAATPSVLPAEFAVEKLPVVAATAHSSSLTELPDGRLAAAWFAGSREGASDVNIWFAIRDAKGWNAPRVVASPADTAAATGAVVRALGNPVLYTQAKRLHLWYVSVAFGGWSVSSINHKTSDDGGETWSPAEKLVTTPFLDISTLVRAPPVALADGGLGLPVYQEFVTKRAEWLRLSPQGRILGKTRMPSPRPGLQPAVAALDEHNALALLRDADQRAGRVMVDVSADGGANWRASVSLDIGNFDSSVALLRLASGRLLLAANPENGRHLLQLFLSDDDGKTWQAARIVESDPAGKAEYSYPALLQTSDGRIHLAYTYRREAISHAVFSEAWLTGAAP
jgi:predicted neuraminidase